MLSFSPSTWSSCGLRRVRRLTRRATLSTAVSTLVDPGDDRGSDPVAAERPVRDVMMRRRLLLLLVIGAFPALPATALAGSVTLTAPPGGATYSLAAGQSPSSGRVTVHLSAVRDRTDCPAAEHITSLFYYEQKKDNEANFGSVFQTAEDSIDGDRSYGVGTWQFRAGFRCTSGGPNGPNLYSSVVTIHVVPYAGTVPTPTPTPTPTSTDPEVRAICERMHGLVNDMSRTNNHIRNDIIPSTKRATTTLKYLSLFGKWGAVAIAANPEIPGSPALAVAYRAQGHAAKAGELYGKVVGIRAKLQVDKYDEIIATQVREYESLCRGVTVAAAIRRSPLRAAAFDASAQSKAAGRLNAALGVLNAHLTKNGARAADVAAVRKRAAAAVKLVSKTIAARKALARKPALKRLHLRKADVPPAMRKNPNVRPFIGKSLSSLLSNKPFKTLRTVLQAQPILP
jgi:hypothetical protein